MEIEDEESETDLEVWGRICEAYLFGEPISDMSTSQAASILDFVERCKSSENCELHEQVTFGEILFKLGWRLEKEDTWVIDKTSLEMLMRAQDAHRAEFHRKAAQQRYSKFLLALCQVVDEKHTSLQSLMDVEQPGLYTETSEMASNQREALRGFVQRFQWTESFRPVFNGLFRALQTQTSSEQVVTWILDDAALVERGHEFAEAWIALVLGEMHFQVALDRTKLEQSRVYTVNPMLSDRRIVRLLALFPSFCYLSKVPISGTFGSADLTRLNRTGERDAPCPQDSAFYELLSRCDIL